MYVHSVPESKMGAPHRPIVLDGVVWIGYPVGSRSDIIILKAARFSDKDQEVVLHYTTSLNPILEEKGSTHHVVSNVVFYENIS